METGEFLEEREPLARGPCPRSSSRRGTAASAYPWKELPGWVAGFLSPRGVHADAAWPPVNKVPSLSCLKPSCGSPALHEHSRHGSQTPAGPGPTRLRHCDPSGHSQSLSLAGGDPAFVGCTQALCWTGTLSPPFPLRPPLRRHLLREASSHTKMLRYLLSGIERCEEDFQVLLALRVTTMLLNTALCGSHSPHPLPSPEAPGRQEDKVRHSQTFRRGD